MFHPKSCLKTDFKEFVINGQAIFSVVAKTRLSTYICCVSVICLCFWACHHTFLFLHRPRHCIYTTQYKHSWSLHALRMGYMYTVICPSTAGLHSEKCIQWRSWCSLKQNIILRCINKQLIGWTKLQAASLADGGNPGSLWNGKPSLSFMHCFRII